MAKLYPLRQRPITAVASPPLIIPNRREAGPGPLPVRNFAYADGSINMEPSPVQNLSKFANHSWRMKFKTYAPPATTEQGIYGITSSLGVEQLTAGNAIGWALFGTRAASIDPLWQWQLDTIHTVGQGWDSGGGNAFNEFDGQREAASVGASGSTGNYRIFDKGRTAAPYFVGFVWDLEIFDGDYAAGANLINYWPMDEGSGNTLTDVVGGVNLVPLNIGNGLTWVNGVTDPEQPV